MLPGECPCQCPFCRFILQSWEPILPPMRPPSKTAVLIIGTNAKDIEGLKTCLADTHAIGLARTPEAAAERQGTSATT